LNAPYYSCKSIAAVGLAEDELETDTWYAVG
jgi:hypothetical protein